MSGHKKWAEIRNHHAFTPEQEAAIAADVRTMLRENALMQLRRRHEISQEILAAALGISQARVSDIERANEPQMSTMRRYIEALGGELVVQAKFDGETFDLLADEPATEGVITGRAVDGERGR
ncbi:MAG: helix-turn-helix domain-containing protein [Thermomicrobiales bacterium]